MIDLILVILFCYQLHRMANQRGLSPMPYVLNYLAVFLLTMIGAAVLFLNFFGADALKDEQGIKVALAFEPFAIAFEIFLFIYFRKKIQKAPINTGNDNDFSPPPPPEKEKKDLSYFR